MLLPMSCQFRTCVGPAHPPTAVPWPTRSARRWSPSRGPMRAAPAGHPDGAAAGSSRSAAAPALRTGRTTPAARSTRCCYPASREVCGWWIILCQSSASVLLPACWTAVVACCMHHTAWACCMQYTPLPISMMISQVYAAEPCRRHRPALQLVPGISHELLHDRHPFLQSLCPFTIPPTCSALQNRR